MFNAKAVLQNIYDEEVIQDHEISTSYSKTEAFNDWFWLCYSQCPGRQAVAVVMLSLGIEAQLPNPHQGRCHILHKMDSVVHNKYNTGLEHWWDLVKTGYCDIIHASLIQLKTSDTSNGYARPSNANNENEKRR